MFKFRIKIDRDENPTTIDISIESDRGEIPGKVDYSVFPAELKLFLIGQGGLYGFLDPAVCTALDLYHALTCDNPANPFKLPIVILEAPEIPEIEPLPEGAIV